MRDNLFKMDNKMKEQQTENSKVSENKEDKYFIDFLRNEFINIYLEAYDLSDDDEDGFFL